MSSCAVSCIPTDWVVHASANPREWHVLNGCMYTDSVHLSVTLKTVNHCPSRRTRKAHVSLLLLLLLLLEEHVGVHGHWRLLHHARWVTTVGVVHACRHRERRGCFCQSATEKTNAVLGVAKHAHDERMLPQRNWGGKGGVTQARLNACCCVVVCIALWPRMKCFPVCMCCL